MRFKRSICGALICFFTEFFTCLTPILIMFNLILVDNKILGFFYAFLIYIGLIFIVNFIPMIALLIAKIFMRTKFYVNDDCLVIKAKKESREIKYTEIGGITYFDNSDFGRGVDHTSKFVLFDKDNNQLLSIEHPSVIMVHLIIKKCKHIKAKCYNNKKSMLVIALIINILALIFILFIKRVLTYS